MFSTNMSERTAYHENRSESDLDPSTSFPYFSVNPASLSEDFLDPDQIVYRVLSWAIILFDSDYSVEAEVSDHALTHISDIPA